MNQIRDVLNKIKWTTKELSAVEIWYVHRGASDDAKILNGSEITEITSWSLETRDSTIPYHRIFRITHEGNDIFQRNDPKKG